MDWPDLKALPIGLVMFGGLVWGFMRRRAGHRLARNAYPELALRLGLDYRAPRSSHQIGQLQGRLRGRSVFVDPDEDRKIIVRFHGEPEIDLRNYESPPRAATVPAYVSNRRLVDDYFKTRYASIEIAERLDAADLDRLLAPFARRYRYEVKQLNVTRHGVSCVLDFGHPPHIPWSAVEVLLPAMLDWADVVEPPEGPATGALTTSYGANWAAD